MESLLFSVEAIVSVIKTSSSSSERLGDSDDRVLSSSVGATVSMDRTSSSSSKKLEDSDDKVLSSSGETIVFVDKISSSKARLDSSEMYSVIPGGSLEIDEIKKGNSEESKDDNDNTGKEVVNKYKKRVPPDINRRQSARLKSKPSQPASSYNTGKKK